MPTTSPREVAEKLLNGISSQDFANLPALYAEDTVVTQPFTTPSPTRIDGRAGLEKHFGTVPPVKLAARNITIHETADPEVVVVEWTYDIEVIPTGKKLNTDNIIVLRVQNGLITESRDYHNHTVFADALKDS